MEEYSFELEVGYNFHARPELRLERWVNSLTLDSAENFSEKVKIKFSKGNKSYSIPDKFNNPRCYFTLLGRLNFTKGDRVKINLEFNSDAIKLSKIRAEIIEIFSVEEKY